jgi:hypothetical protein
MREGPKEKKKLHIGKQYIIDPVTFIPLRSALKTSDFFRKLVKHTNLRRENE